MFVKTVKNNAYFKRFQVKFRRRREGKTDYYQRKRLINQKKNKYNTPKYRFVVRKTNTKVICQVISSTVDGDLIKAQAQSTELKKFGITAGLTNYSACYATGLLCSRRLLTTIDEDNKALEGWNSISTRFNFVPETTGEYIDIEKEAEKKDVGRPFVCYLDLGLFRSTKGARVFAAMKGAVDGGIHIPHSDKIFPSPKEVVDKKGKKETAATGGNLLRERIFGGHVQKYMDLLAKDKEAYKKQFSKWEQCLAKAGVKKIEDLYKKALAEIRKNPKRVVPQKKEQKKVVADSKDPNVFTNGKHKYRRDQKLNREQRRKRVNEKIAKFVQERKKAAEGGKKKK